MPPHTLRHKVLLGIIAKHLTTRLLAPKRHHATYSRWYRYRYLMSTLAVLMAAVVVIPVGMVAFRDTFNNPNKKPHLTAPSLAELNNSITLAQRYISALFKPLPEGGAVQSEASGVPLKAYFPTENRWVLLGEEVRLCYYGSCQPTTSINPLSASRTTEQYAIEFDTPAVQGAFTLAVDINWAHTATTFRISLRPLYVAEPVEVWLDDHKLESYTPDVYKPSVHDFPTNDQTLLRTLRYTVRHATQEAYLFWGVRGRDPQRAAALAGFLNANGFTPGYDLRAPLYVVPRGLPDNLPVNTGAYEDCDHLPASDTVAYAYKSKVCLFRDTYLLTGERDPFLQAWQALDTLGKYDDPNHEVPEWHYWVEGSTPASIARTLRGQWNRTGYGIPKCTPFSCNEMSGIRTFIFGALETALGYHYGDAAARLFADAAARMTVIAQVKTDGLIHMKTGTFYRPGQIGAYLAAWDTADARFLVPYTPAVVGAIAFWLTNQHPVPPEYPGIQPSNSETTLDGLGFLYAYRCAKYGVGC